MRHLQSSPGPGAKGALLWAAEDSPQCHTAYDTRLLVGSR